MQNLSRIADIFPYWQLEPSAAQKMCAVEVAELYESAMGYQRFLRGLVDGREGDFAGSNKDLLL